jgi:hypothetical protein
MLSLLNIFKLEHDGSLVWKASAQDLGTAKLNMRVLAVNSPGDYIVSSQRTGHKTIVKIESGS